MTQILDLVGTIDSMNVLNRFEYDGNVLRISAIKQNIKEWIRTDESVDKKQLKLQREKARNK